MKRGGALYAVLWNYQAMIEAFVARREELQISCSDLDAVARLPSGYAGKVLGASQFRRFSMESTLKMAKALGLRVVLEVDTKATERTLARRPVRMERAVRTNNYARQPSIRIERRVRAILGRRGAITANANRDTKAHARMMAQARWGRRRHRRLR